MATPVTPQDIAEYRALAKEGGRETSHLSDAQVARQIQILRGGLHRPSKADLDEIRARAKSTDKLFLQAQQGVFSELEKALSDLQRMDPPSSVRRKTPKAPLRLRRAKRLLALQRALLAYPPSMLGPAFRRALDRVGEWSSLAAKALDAGSPAGEKALSSVPRRLTSMIEGLKKALAS